MAVLTVRVNDAPFWSTLLIWPIQSPALTRCFEPFSLALGGSALREAVARPPSRDVSRLNTMKRFIASPPKQEQEGEARSAEWAEGGKLALALLIAIAAATRIFFLAFSFPCGCNIAQPPYRPGMDLMSSWEAFAHVRTNRRHHPGRPAS